MQTPEYAEGSNEAVKRDEQAHAEAECEAEEERVLWERVDAAESRVQELERCIKAMAEEYRKNCRYMSARMKEWQRVYGVSV
jgi:hypothetical protein